MESSDEGVQQGDPLGPLLISMALDNALKIPKCDMVAAYLDDVVLGGMEWKVMRKGAEHLPDGHLFPP